MKNELSCAIVRDLLPLYVDELVSAETKNAVGEHLEECGACKSVLRDIMPEQQEKESNIKQVDYLKKVRTKSMKWTSIITIVGIILTLFGISMIYYTGSESQSSDIVYQTSVEGKTICIEMKAASDTQRISRVEFSSSKGMVNVDVYTTPKLFFENAEKDYSYTIDYDVTQVHMGNTVLWENGMDISEKASILYSSWNPFVGNMPSNMQIANALRVSEQFGNYTNELKTDSIPYGWTLKLEHTIPASKEALSMELMRADSCVFLALIDNLDYVVWEYPTENGVETFKYTREDATEFCGKDIKHYVGSVSDIQTLLNILGVNE